MAPTSPASDSAVSMAAQPRSAAPTADATHDYSGPLRLWHWANWPLISAQLITILFLKVILGLHSAAPEFQRILSKDGLTISQQQARSLTRVIADNIWTWHTYIGLVLAAFWLFRVALELRGPAPKRFTTRLMETARRFRLAPAAEHADARHALFAKTTYALFYIFLTVMVLTGLALTWADDVAFLGRIEHTVKEIHNVTMYLIIGFFVLHLAGVVWAELTKDHGLISRMISGK